jgi:hypothetical protein
MPQKRTVSKKPVSKAKRNKAIAKKHQTSLAKNKRKQRRTKVLKQKGFAAANNNSKYKQGKFWSKKNQKEYVFRSAYEFGYFLLLEEDESVVSYIVEPFQVPYRYNNVTRTYWPDLLVLYRDGSMKIIEIKPLALVDSKQVQAKAAGCRLFISQRLKNTTYEFVTEKDIFESDTDYKKLVKMIK